MGQGETKESVKRDFLNQHAIQLNKQVNSLIDSPLIKSNNKLETHLDGLVVNIIKANPIHVAVGYEEHKDHFIYLCPDMVELPEWDDIWLLNSSFCCNRNLTWEKKLLELVSVCNGRIFGGYIRNIIIPEISQQYNNFNVLTEISYSPEETERNFEDLNIWFQTEEDELLFTRRLEYNHNIYDSRRFGVIRKIYQADKFTMTTFISSKFPVDDYSINRLTYSPKEGFKSFGKYSVKFLIKFIIEKKATMSTFQMEECDLLQWNEQNNKVTRLLLNGWKIFDSVAFDVIPFLFFVLDNLVNITDIKRHIINIYFNQIRCWNIPKITDDMKLLIMNVTGRTGVRRLRRNFGNTGLTGATGNTGPTGNTGVTGSVGRRNYILD